MRTWSRRHYLPSIRQHGYGGDAWLKHAKHSLPTWLTPVTPSEQYRPLMEKESDRQLPFLDILLSREEDGSIGTSVHHKATHTDQYLCFHSHHPAAHKQAVVKTMMCRAEVLSSSGVSCTQEEKLVSRALQGNGYPKSFIHKHTWPGDPWICDSPLWQWTVRIHP